MTIREAILQISKDDFSFGLRLGIVRSISIDKKTCAVSPFDNETFTINDVRLALGEGNYVQTIPKTNSIVLIGEIQKFEWVVLLIANVDTISLLDGTFGGLVKVVSLVSRLNLLENKVNDHLSAYNTHVHVGVTTGGGSSGATPSIIAGTLTNTVRGDVENADVTHGAK